MLTIGFGDIYPETDNEKIFTIFILMIACGVFSYIIGSV
jgi:hyperpolarization activated cyclic nucleotide-gated potassium channel 2